MEPNMFPTKGNLIIAKNTLRMSRQGYDLLDRKRNVLIREIMNLNERAADIQSVIKQVFAEAYASLQKANIDIGLSTVERISHGVSFEENIRVRSRSVMGVDIPMATITTATPDTERNVVPFYGFGDTSSALDDAVKRFDDVKALIVRLASIENAAYRLAVSIKKMQKRANALKNITIPRFEALVKSITETLEERERDEFTRLKVIKRKK